MAIVIWRNLRLILADIVFFLLGYFIGFVIFRGKGISEIFSLYFFVQLLVWLLISTLFKKYAADRVQGITRLTWVLMLCNILILLVSILVINRLFPEHAASKWFYFWVVLMISVQELIFFGLFQSYLAARKKELWESEESFVAAVDAGFPVSGTPVPDKGKKISDVLMPVSPEVRTLILGEIGEVPYHAISEHIERNISPLLVVSTNTRFNIDIQPLAAYGTIINLMKINSIRYLNKFFEVVNGKLNTGGIFIGRAEVYSTRKERILRYYPPVINYLVYTLDFLLNRVAPKLPFTKQVYFALTGGRERVLSRTETLGRLYSCGFEVIDDKEVNDLYYFIVRKTREPYFDNNPTYGALIKLNRVGKDGKIIGIYKLRTMHPYSEYLQPYIYEKNKLREGGKFRDDFRVTTLGAFARKVWIDELPMFINLIRGEVKLVGVRPLSRHFFNLYTPELKEKRIRTKPGLIPPYYADMPKTLEEVMASESKYLDEYFRHPIRTDLKYLLKALYQIIFRFARSG
jgi:lipopolysaccharide/colanic/teichoic acid biosynthesis glycosyltransferase